MIEYRLQVRPDWVQCFADANAIREAFRDIGYKGPGWYLRDGVSILITTSKSGVFLPDETWHDDPPTTIAYYAFVYNCDYHNTVFGGPPPPMRNDARHTPSIKSRLPLQPVR